VIPERLLFLTCFLKGLILKDLDHGFGLSGFHDGGLGVCKSAISVCLLEGEVEGGLDVQQSVLVTEVESTGDVDGIAKV